jgi:hypothetical protein
VIWGELTAAPPFRLSADTVAEVQDLVRASRLAQPENTRLVAEASRHMAALTSAVALRKSKDEIVREAHALAAWALRCAEEGDATFSEGRQPEASQP